MSKLDQIKALRIQREDRRQAQSAPLVEVVTALAKRPLSEADVINALREETKSVINKSARRQTKWRESNLEQNRQRARDGMRKRRAKDNATPQEDNQGSE